MSGDVERLAEVLFPHPDGSCLWGEQQARSVLASDWLAAHDAEVAARALREAADEVDVYVPGACQTCEDNVVTACEIWLRARADRVAGHEGGADRG